MPKLDGLEVLKRSKKLDYHLPFIMISGHGDLDTAVECIKNGAYDFLEKPFKSEKILILTKNALQSAKLINENKLLKTSLAISDQKIFGSFIELL